MKERLFLVYGSLKKNFSNHPILEHPSVEFLGEVVTEPKFTMVSYGGFPAVIPGGETAIKGEVYKVGSEEVVRRLNMLEGYRVGSSSNFYDVMPIETPYGEASMYIQHINRRSLPIIKSGDWKNQ